MVRLVLGLVPADRTRERATRARVFMRALGERAGVYIVERNVSSYDELEREITLAHIDIAWLPPMVFARLERAFVVVALATRSRPNNAYTAVLVSARGSGRTTLEHVRGARIAWVDPLSASGYVVPRLGLLAQGIDPRTTFAQEFFAGSHAEAVRAVLEGHADIAATYANLDERERVGHGVWTEIGASVDDFHIVAMLGEIPPDLIAARASVPEEQRDAVVRAFLDMAAETELGDAIESIFGGRRFERGTSSSYRALRDLLGRASDAGLGGASDAYISTTPPGAA
jgi:phosphate/phosphite/phosphonate ABC transporter binding protein